MKPPETRSEERAVSTDSLYLSRLSFREELKNGLLYFFVSRFRVVLLLIAILSGSGLYAFSTLPRESNPEVKIPFAVVATPYPGASPSDVEDLVTKKIETAISGIQGIKKLTSSSSNSLSVVSVEFEANEDLDSSIRKVRDRVTSVKDLPDDAQDPQVNEISFDDTPIWTISLTGDYDGFVLREYAEKLQEEFEKIPGIREVRVSGGDEHEFEVAYDPVRLAAYGISPDQTNRAIALTNVAIPGGNFKGENFQYAIRTDAKTFSAKDIAGIVVGQTGQKTPILLSDVANVRETSIERVIFSRFSVDRQPSQNAVSIDIIKRTGGSIIDTVAQARSTADAMLKTFPSGMRYEATLDLSKQIKQDFDQLQHDFFITVALVMGILFLIVGLKESIVAGLAIPLTFFATFTAMSAFGVSLNFLSIFSLLLSLGVLVDDAIVVVSATKQYLRTGKFTPEQAVLLVLNDFKVVLVTTSLTTVWAFLPLLFATGIIGQFIKSIPITVSVTLVSSLLIALFINHPLAAVMERIRFTKGWFLLIVLSLGILLAYCATQWKTSFWFILAATILAAILIAILFWYRSRGKRLLKANAILVDAEWKSDALIKEKLRAQAVESHSIVDRLIHGIVGFERVIPIYEKALRPLVKKKRLRRFFLGGVTLLFAFAVSLPATGIVKTEFFPMPDEDNLFISIEAPIGMRLENTDGIIRQVEEKLLAYEEIRNFATVVGQRGVNPSDAGGGGSGSSQGTSHLGGIVVTLVGKDDRERTSFGLADIIRDDLSTIQGALISVEAPRAGPPGGAAFEARIIGDDLKTLEMTADRLRAVVSGIPGVVNAKISLKQAPAELTFHLDPETMSLYGLNAASVGQYVRLAVSGIETSTVLSGNKEVKIIARLDKEKIPTLESVQNMQIPNGSGQFVFLRDVAHVELRPAVDAITRIDQKRSVLLSAGVTGTTTSNEILAAFQEKLKNEAPLPEGYSISYGGENEQNQESVLSIIRAMVVAIVLIFATLIIQFNSTRKSLIVLVTLPLALIGVFLGMGLLGVALSFPGLIGILALFGIVVKNAIILVDKMNLNLASGIAFDDSVIDAGKSRIEAIFITSIATIAGIVPVTLSNPIWTALGSAIIFGLSISSFFTLFVIPALFCELIPKKDSD